MADTGRHIAVASVVAGMCTDKNQTRVGFAHKARSRVVAAHRDQSKAGMLLAAAVAAAPADRRDRMAMIDMDRVD